MFKQEENNSQKKETSQIIVDDKMTLINQSAISICEEMMYKFFENKKQSNDLSIKENLHIYFTLKLGLFLHYRQPNQ